MNEDIKEPWHNAWAKAREELIVPIGDAGAAIVAGILLFVFLPPVSCLSRDGENAVFNCCEGPVPFTELVLNRFERIRIQHLSLERLVPLRFSIKSLVVIGAA